MLSNIIKLKSLDLNKDVNNNNSPTILKIKLYNFNYIEPYGSI